jgi:hypothetical protein
MGETTEDGIQIKRESQTATGEGSLLDRVPEKDPQTARDDSNFFRSAVIVRLDTIIDLLGGGENAQDLLEAINKNTKAQLILVKALTEQASDKETTADTADPPTG